MSNSHDDGDDSRLRIMTVVPSVICRKTSGSASKGFPGLIILCKVKDEVDDYSNYRQKRRTKFEREIEVLCIKRSVTLRLSA